MTQLSASPKASLLQSSARLPRRAGRQAGARPPLPGALPRRTCGRSCWAPREGGARDALPPPQVPQVPQVRRGRGSSSHSRGLGAPGPRRPLPGGAGGSGGRGGGGARAGGGGSPASTGSRPAEQGGRRRSSAARPEVPRRFPGWARGRGRQGRPALLGMRLSRQPPPLGAAGARCPAALPALPLACGQGGPHWRRAWPARCPPGASTAIGREKALAFAIGRSALPIGAVPRAPRCRPRNVG